MDFFQTLQNFINIPAALVGVAAVLGAMYFLPSPTPEKPFGLIPGSLGSRLIPRSIRWSQGSYAFSSNGTAS
jgi:hypothetical protein